MNNKIERVGNFTSSGIGALMTRARDGNSFGAPAITYIEEKRIERRLGRSLNSDISSRPTAWGNLVENRVFDILGLDYKLTSKETISHPDIDCWCGSPDGEKFSPDAWENKNKTVFDIKCPFTLKSFCTLADCTTIEEVREKHKEGDTYYWQLVSNSILTGAKYAELIVYCPFKSELPAIRDLANNYDGPKQNQFAFINWAEDNELPWIPDGGYYKNINIIHFEVPESDKQLLTDSVVAASKKIASDLEKFIFLHRIHSE